MTQNVTPTQAYTYDGVGNRLSNTASGATTNYSYPAISHRLSGLTGAQARVYQYDAVGNTINDGIKTYAYAGNNRLSQVTLPGAQVNYLINALGQRVKKSSTAGAANNNTRFVYDEAGRLVGEYDDQGVLIQETVWLNDVPVAVLK